MQGIDGQFAVSGAALPRLSRVTRVRTEARALLTLAAPLILGFVGNQMLGLVDTAMVGRLGEVDLAGVAVGNGLYFAIGCVGLGTVLGADPLLSQAVGAGEGARFHAVQRASLRLAVWMALPLMVAIAILMQVLPAFGVESATAHATGQFLLGRLPGVLPFLLFNSLRGVLQARSTTRPIIIASVVGNVVNIVANSLLIFGDTTLVWMHLPRVGLPALGVLGSGLSSSLAQTSMFLVLFAALGRLEPMRGEGDRAVTVRSVFRVGFPIGLTLMAEVGAFAAVGVLAARIGPSAAAGHQVAITLASTTFIVTLALGAATSVRVGQAVGRGDSSTARLTGFVGLGASSVFMSFTAALFLIFAPSFAGLLSDRPEVIAAAVPLIHIAAVFQIFDGAQAVGSGALRGIGDTRFIQTANLIGYYLVGLPVAAVLAFGLHQQERGLWWGLTAGLVAVATLLFARFSVRSRGVIARLE